MASWRALAAWFVGMVFLNLAPTARGADGGAVVYSGIFHNDVTRKDYLVRVHFMDVTPPSGTQTIYNTVVIFHLGGEDDPEYLSLNYDRVGMRAATREVVMPSLMTGNADHLPIIHLAFDPSGATATGEMTSREERGTHGHFTLVSGWDFHAQGPVAQPVSGLYEAQCDKPVDGSAMNLDMVDLMPARFNAKTAETAFAMNRITYRGSGVCPYTGLVNCLTVDNGSYRLLDDTVEFSQASWRFECQRRGDDTLNCTSNIRYPHCTLRRTARLPRAPARAKADVPVAPIAFAPPKPATAAAVACEEWAGDYAGLLTHRLNGRQQAVAVQLRSFAEDAPGGGTACTLLASAILNFATYEAHGEKIAFTFATPVAVLPDTKTVSIADPTNDLILQITRDGDGRMHGLWGSRIFGVVGTWSGVKGGDYPAIGSDRAVFGVSGYFTRQGSPGDLFAVTARRLGASVNLLDPFGAIQLSGWRSRHVASPNGNPAGMDFRQQITQSYYDYFTDFLAFYTTGALYTGNVSAQGLSLRVSATSYLAVANPVDLVYLYERRRGPNP